MSDSNPEIERTTRPLPADGGAAPEALSRILTVESCHGPEFMLRGADGGPLAARRAVSCLVEPSPGDKVLTAVSNERAYVLAVLERANGDAPVTIAAPGELVLSAKRISVRTEAFDLVAEAANLVGNAFNSLFRTSKRVAGTDETIARSTTVSAHERVSVIAGSDVHRAGVFCQSIDSAMAQSAHTAVVTAKTDIRLNAERINVG